MKREFKKIDLIRGLHASHRRRGGSVKRIYSEKVRRRAIAMYVDAKLSCRTVAGALKTELNKEFWPQTVMGWIREAGLSRAVGGRRTVELPKGAKRDYGAGMSIDEIAGRYGVGTTTVAKRLREAGTRIRPSGSRYARLLTEERLRRLYVQQGYTATQIARKYHCATGTIYNWLRRGRIPPQAKSGKHTQPLTIPRRLGRSLTDRWRNPKLWLPILLVAAGLAAGMIWVIQQTYPALDLSFPYTIALAAFTAMLGAGMAMWVYSYIQHESQRRQWGHEREERHFEEIYGPLYEDVLKALGSLRDYGTAWLQSWRDIKEKKVGPFVEEGIRQNVIALEKRLEELSSVGQESREAAKTCIEEAYNRYPVEAGRFQDIQSILTQDQRFLFDPRVGTPSFGILNNLQEVLRKGSNIETDEDIAKYIRHIKEFLRKDPTIQKRAELVESILPEAEALYQQIRHRMTYPFE